MREFDKQLVDEFAISAMIGLLTRGAPYTMNELAKDSYDMASVMMRERSIRDEKGLIK